jgi:hypothetical protein
MTKEPTLTSRETYLLKGPRIYQIATRAQDGAGYMKFEVSRSDGPALLRFYVQSRCPYFWGHMGSPLVVPENSEFIISVEFYDWTDETSEVIYGVVGKNIEDAKTIYLDTGNTVPTIECPECDAFEEEMKER